MFRTAGAEPAPTSSSTLVAAVVQAGARLFDTPANLAAAERWIRDAAGQGARPDVFTLGVDETARGTHP